MTRKTQILLGGGCSKQWDDGREGVRGIFISHSDFCGHRGVRHPLQQQDDGAVHVARDCYAAVERGRLLALLQRKVRAAILDKKPFVEILN